jgi:hypothetical protein
MDVQLVRGLLSGDIVAALYKDALPLAAAGSDGKKKKPNKDKEGDGGHISVDAPCDTPRGGCYSGDCHTRPKSVDHMIILVTV